MDAVSYSELRQNLARHLDRVAADGAPLLVTRAGKDAPVVMLSLAEFEGWVETVHLLRSPANAARLLVAAEAARAGQLTERDPDAA
jgi:antitoxin YefM